ncbi:hypothetical protein AGROH133_09885 [Agrobacterium tumefaciens]|nr:hypothetical protein AGROH133_09885 [Agrobacterium tumefaciens]
MTCHSFRFIPPFTNLQCASLRGMRGSKKEDWRYDIRISPHSTLPANRHSEHHIWLRQLYLFDLGWHAAHGGCYRLNGYGAVI